MGVSGLLRYLGCSSPFTVRAASLIKECRKRLHIASVFFHNVQQELNTRRAAARVSQKTRDKVNAIIEEYGYVPNLNARSLSNKKSHIIGIIISLDEKDVLLGTNYFENPYVSTMVGAIERELQKNEYFTMIRSVSKNADIISLLKNWNVDGIIILYPAAGEYMARLMDSATCPIATFDCELEHPNLINITSNDEKGLYLSTKYMINHGHSAIAFVADYKSSHVLANRFNGYKRALEENHITFNPARSSQSRKARSWAWRL